MPVCWPLTGSTRPVCRSSSRRTPTSAARGSRTRTRAAASTIPNHLYSYSFAQSHDWPQHYSTQAVLLDYFRDCADEFGAARPHPLRDRGATRAWTTTTRHVAVGCATPTAPRRRSRRNAVISAVGQLNRPNLPDIAGRDDFEGPSFHSGALGPRRRPEGQARRGDRHRRQRLPVHPGDRASAPASCTSSSARRRGSARRPTTTTPCPAGSAGCSSTCPHYAKWYRFWLSGPPTGRSAGVPRSTRTGTPTDGRSAR